MGLILANILVISTAKKPVDSAICVILYLEVQIVQNVQHFAILVSINVTVYVKLVKPDAQYPILRHQLIFELQLFLQYQMMIKLLELKLLLKPANIMPHLIVKKTCGLCDLCTPTSTRAECSTLCKLGREKCTKFCQSGQDRCLTFFANMF